MKRSLLILLTLTFAVAAMAQLSKTASRYEKRVPLTEIDNPVLGPVMNYNPVVSSKSALDEDDLGTTRYDVQTNASCMPRIIVYPDGTISTAWMMGQLDATSFPDRGTGYNYFDGTAWGTAPSARIESVRTGWSAIAPWNGNGELVLAHNSTATLVMNTRPEKGTGAWTQKLAPATPSGAPPLLWPTVMTSGTNNQNVHILTMTAPTANSGALYNGLDGALLYYRSTDGGTTWDKNGVQLPGLTVDNYDAFSSDKYVWGKPHGDTIYFCVGGPYTDTFIMYSYDNGTTWTKMPILSNGYSKIASTVTDLPPWRSSDGSMAVALGPGGVFHFASGIGGGSMEAGSKYIRLYNNGLIYWNSTMEMLPDSLDLDTLQAHGQLGGWYSDGPAPGDTLNTLTSYRVGLCSHPQITFNDNGDMCLIYGQYTWANPEPSTGLNFSHVFARGWFNGSGWSSENGKDLQDGVSYIFTEFVYPSVANRVLNNTLEYIVQTSPSPGTAVGTAGTTGALAYRTDNIFHYSLSFDDLWTSVNNPAAVDDNIGQVFPNPVNDKAKINVSLKSTSNVTIVISTLAGQNLSFSNHGILSAGSHQIVLDIRNLKSGLYLCTVTVNGQSFTRKMIVD